MHTAQNKALQQNGLKDLTIILISIFFDEMTLRMLCELTNKKFTNMLGISKNIFGKV